MRDLRDLLVARVRDENEREYLLDVEVSGDVYLKRAILIALGSPRGWVALSEGTEEQLGLRVNESLNLNSADVAKRFIKGLRELCEPKDGNVASVELKVERLSQEPNCSLQVEAREGLVKVKMASILFTSCENFDSRQGSLVAFLARQVGLQHDALVEETRNVKKLQRSCTAMESLTEQTLANQRDTESAVMQNLKLILNSKKKTIFDLQAKVAALESGNVVSSQKTPMGREDESYFPEKGRIEQEASVNVRLRMRKGHAVSKRPLQSKKAKDQELPTKNDDEPYLKVKVESKEGSRIDSRGGTRDGISTRCLQPKREKEKGVDAGVQPKLHDVGNGESCNESRLVSVEPKPEPKKPKIDLKSTPSASIFRIPKFSLLPSDSDSD